MITLHIEPREKTQKLDILRQSGKMPAVFYGRKEKATSVFVSQAEFTKVWKKAGDSSIIELKDAKGVEHQALIKVVDVHPLSGDFRHADFYVIEKDKKLQIEVPMHFVGVAPAVKDLGGILVKVLHALKIEALPKDLPQLVEVNIGTLAAFDSQILAKDIALPANVTLVQRAEDVVASIAKPVEEKEEPVAAPDLAAIEISDKKGKKPEEGAEGAPAADGKAAPAKDAKAAPAKEAKK